MSAAIIRPGDVLLLTMPDDMLEADAQRLREFVLTKLPGLSNVVVLAGIEVAGVYREGDD